MGVRYVEQGLLWLAGKGFQQKWAGKLFLKSEAKFWKNFSNTLNKNSEEIIYGETIYTNYKTIEAFYKKINSI